MALILIFKFFIALFLILYFIISAVLAKVISKSASMVSRNGAIVGAKDDIRYNVHIQIVYKAGEESKYPVKGASTLLVVPAKGLECRCPNIKLNK